jgi:hypothetical protein
MSEGGDVEPQTNYREGVRCRWFLGDARHLAEVMRGAPRGFPGKYPSRLRTLAHITIPRRGTFHDNFSLRDPLPELGDWLDFLLRRLGKKRSARRGVEQAGSESSKRLVES